MSLIRILSSTQSYKGKSRYLHQSEVEEEREEEVLETLTNNGHTIMGVGRLELRSTRNDASVQQHRGRRY